MNKTLSVLMAVLALGVVINSKVGVQAAPQFGLSDLTRANNKPAGIYDARRSVLNIDLVPRATNGAAGILDANRRLFNVGLLKANSDGVKKAIASGRKVTVLRGPGNVMVTMNS